MARTLADMVAEVRWMADAEGQDDVTGRHSRDAIVRAINLACRDMRTRVMRVNPGLYNDTAVGDATEPYYLKVPGASVGQILAVQARRGLAADGGIDWFPVQRDTLESVWRMQTEERGPPRAWAQSRRSDGDWNLVFAPLQDQDSYAIRVLYQKQFVDLVSDADTLDDIDGFSQVVALDAAVRLAMRDANSDGRAQLLMAERDRAERAMLEAVRPRLASCKSAAAWRSRDDVRPDRWP